jgi:hypothetical protein
MVFRWRTQLADPRPHCAKRIPSARLEAALRCTMSLVNVLISILSDRSVDCKCPTILAQILCPRAILKTPASGRPGASPRLARMGHRCNCAFYHRLASFVPISFCRIVEFRTDTSANSSTVSRFVNILWLSWGSRFPPPLAGQRSKTRDQ